MLYFSQAGPGGGTASFQLCFGCTRCTARQCEKLKFFLVDSIPKNATWTVSGIGRHELSLAAAAIGMGGHVRVGFEDNIYYRRGGNWPRVMHSWLLA